MQTLVSCPSMLKSLLTASVVLLFLSGCNDAGTNKFSEPQSAVSLSEKLVDYDTEKAVFQLTGTLDVPGAVPLTVLSFYLNESCTGTIAGSLVYQEFATLGALLQVPLIGAARIFVKTNSATTCHFVKEVTPDVAVVRVPVFTRTEPVSPSRLTAQPGVFGSAFPALSTVEFFGDPACLNPVGSGTADQFRSSGISLSLTPEQQTDLFAQVIDPRGLRSACTPMAPYVHSSALAGAPQFLKTFPVSPNNSSTTPLVKGGVATNIVTVKLFSNSNCSTEIGSGTAAAFRADGIEAQVGENQSTSIYAKTFDNENRRSNCILLTTYLHDTSPPAAPVFGSALPASPTRISPFPKIRGTAAVDSLSIRLYAAANCTPAQLIGSGLKSAFESTGVTASLRPNSTSPIYGASLDAAGNSSPCVEFTSYRHNNIPPTAPTFDTSAPESPTNQTTTPRLLGVGSDTTVSLTLFSDELCSVEIGAGTAEDFLNPGISVSVTANQVSAIYARPTDPEGNIGECAFLTLFEHSVNPAPAPTFTFTFPNSPTRSSSSPFVAGTADISVTSIALFADSSCATQLNEGSRIQFSTAGLPVTLPMNATSTIYAVSTDKFGNFSPCVYLTDFTHTVLPPMAPTLTGLTPATPNNFSTAPVLRGAALPNLASPLPVAKIVLYDTAACISKLGEASAANFSGTGVTVNVPENAVTTIYAKSFDAVSNSSACVHMVDYVHDALLPGRPLFVATLPASPSYSTSTSVRGSFASSPDFMPKTSVTIFSDSICTAALASAAPATFESSGVPFTVPSNAVTTLFAASQNELGTWSECSSLASFRHHDLAPSNFALSNNPDGSVQLSWISDTISSPPPTYRVKRARQSGGPYTIISSGSTSPSFTDQQVTQAATYHYVIQATNSTGASVETTELSTTIIAPPPVAVAALTVTAGPQQAVLAWTGFPVDMKYRVLRSGQTGGPYTLIADDLTNGLYVDSGLINGNTYFYVVHGFNPAGQSINSPEKAIVPLANPGAPSGFRLAPRAASADCSGAPGVHLIWTPPAYFDRFEIGRSVAGSSNSTFSSTVPDYVDCNPDTNGTRENLYNVGSIWGSTQSVNTPQLSFWASGAAALFARPGDGHVWLTWSAPAGATSLDIYKSTSPGGPYQLFLPGFTGSSYVDSTVTNSTSAYYWIQGRDGLDYVGWPSLTSGGSADNAPTAPTNLVLSSTPNSIQVNLSWTVPSHFNRFAIYSATSSGGPYTLLSYSNTNSFIDGSAPPGTTFYRVAAQWGNSVTPTTNTVLFRRAQVTGLNLTRQATQLSLSWTAFAGAQDYEIQRATSSVGPFTAIAITAANNYIDTSVVAGEGYHYSIVPRFADGTQGQRSATRSGITSGSTIPSGLSILGTNSNSVNVAWVAPSVAVNYFELARATSIGGPYTLVDTTASSTTSYNFHSLPQRTLFYFRVTAVIGAARHVSVPISAATLTANSTPVVTPGNAQLDVSWSLATGATNYHLQRSTDRQTFTTIASNLVTSNYLDSGVTNGTLYFYRVQTNYPAGSNFTASTEGHTPGITPTASQGLWIQENLTGTSVKLAWNSSPNASRYNVFQAASAAGPWVTPIMSATANSDVEVLGLTAGVRVYFRVTAVSGNQESGFSNVAGVIPALPPTAPAVTFGGPGTVNLSWTAVPGATSYRLDRSEDGYNFFTIQSGLATTTTTDSSVDPQIGYRYRFQAFASGNEPLPVSLVSSAIAVGAGPVVPQAFTARALSATSVFLQWANVSQAAGYRVFRSTTAGGPYSDLGFVAAPATSYTETGLTPTTTYYYVIRAQSILGVPSNPSLELAVATSAAPGSLTAINVDSAVNLTWTVVPAATQYRVLRSEISGGPYGQVATSVTTSAQDLTAVPGVAYEYVVIAEFASGARSPMSAPVSLTKTGYLDLEIPIEMIDRGISSVATEARSFLRSTTAIDPLAYDGVTSFIFEVIATNQEAAARSVLLIDQNDSTIASLVVPANTFSPRRLQVAATFPVAETVYRIRLPQTSSAETLTIVIARLKIRQVNATKTKLFFPLISSSEGPSPADEGASVNLIQSTSFNVPEGSMGYVRDVAKLSQLVAYNAWELDTIASANDGAEGTLALWNSDRNDQVSGTSTEIKGSTPRRALIAIDEGQTRFGSTNEGELMEVALRCDKLCTQPRILLYKAGLWVRLQNLTKAQIVHRVATAVPTLVSSADLLNSRTLMDLGNFTSPQIVFAARASAGMSGSLQVSLISDSTNDAGSSSLTLVPDSTLTFGPSASVQSQTSLALTLTTGDRVIVNATPSAGSAQLNGASLVLNIGP